MDALQLERDVFEPRITNVRRYQPTQAQIRYASDLCRTELPYADRVRTIASFEALTSQEMSQLISELEAARETRMARLRRMRRRRR